MGLAKELIFTGSMIDAKRAFELGIINHIFDEKTLREQTIALASGIALKNPFAISLIKTAMNKGMEMNIESAFALELSCFGLCFATGEQKKAMDKFVNKNKG
jgi:enoyl-CoA hydratase